VRAPARRVSELDPTAREPGRAALVIARVELERAADEWQASARVFEALEDRGDASAWIG
jgi:hypothetical protein